jgi:hypothetical protein
MGRYVNNFKDGGHEFLESTIIHWKKQGISPNRATVTWSEFWTRYFSDTNLEHYSSASILGTLKTLFHCCRASFQQSAQSSSVASLCHTLNLWPATFSQAWLHMTVWELASQDIYDETYGYIFCKFFSLQNFISVQISTAHQHLYQRLND